MGPAHVVKFILALKLSCRFLHAPIKPNLNQLPSELMEHAA